MDISGSKDEVLAKLRQVFQRVDSDRSGYVDAKELKAIMEKLGVPLDDENRIVLLKRFDRDGNGRLESAEFCEMLYFVMETKKAFDTADADKSGSITPRELAGIFPRLGIKLKKENIVPMVRLFDEDGSGHMDYQEFFSLIAYFQELNYQYDIYKDEGVGDARWLAQLINDDDPKVVANAARALQAKGTLSYDDFCQVIMEQAVAASSVGFGRRKKGPKIVASQNRARKQAPIRHMAGASSLAKKQNEELLAKHRGGAGPSSLGGAMSGMSVSGKKYEDQHFGPVLTLCPPGTRSHVTAWKRPTELSPSARLFVDGVDEGDVIQGGLGDCWFLGALAVIATSVGNNFVQHLFVSHDMAEGRLRCKFYKNGDWQVVEIDDRLPINAANRPVFASCKDSNEFWVPLLEKAYAKCHGSFDSIEMGNIADGLKDLTGESVETILIDKAKPETYAGLFERLVFNIKESYLMGCTIEDSGSRPEHETPMGLLINHAYSIIDAQQVNGVKLLRIRNPWGRCEWKGAWADESREWTPALLKHFDYEFGNDGTFFMEFSDFIRNFNRIYVLRLLTDDEGEKWNKFSFDSEWNAATAGGCTNHPTWHQNPQFAVVPSAPGKVFVCLSQPDLRYVHKAAPNVHGKRYDPIGVAIYETDDPRFKKTSSTGFDKVATSMFCPVRDLSFEFIAQAGKKYIILPCTFQPKIINKFEIAIYTQSAAKCFEVKDSLPKKEIKGAWSGRSAGGCVNEPATWMNNPQYVLTVDRPGKVTLALDQDLVPGQEVECMGLYVMKGAGGRRLDRPTQAVYSPPTFLNTPSVSGEFKAEPGVQYIVMPTTFDAGIQRSYTIAAASMDGANVTFQQAM